MSQQLESTPGSIHKYDKPEENLILERQWKPADQLKQIAQQLFALCYNVEEFIDRPRELQHGNLSDEVWRFFHEVILRLPRTLDPDHIREARVELYEALYYTERNKLPKITEFVNPGANFPEPLTLQKHTQMGDDGKVAIETSPIEIQAMPESNEYTQYDFMVDQGSVVATDGTEYIVEFIPDSDAVEEQEEVKPKREPVKEPAPKPSKGKAKAAPKKGKGTVVAAKNTTAERQTAPAKTTKLSAAGKVAKTAQSRARVVATSKSRSSSPEFESSFKLLPPSPTPKSKPKRSARTEAVATAPLPPAPSSSKKRSAEEPADEPSGSPKKARKGAKTQETAPAAAPVNTTVRRSTRTKS